MGQTGCADSAVQEAAVPTLLLQCTSQMLANAAGCNAFLCKQHCFIFRHSTDKFICKGIQLYKLQNVRILRCIVQLLGSVQQVLQFVRIADQKDLRPWRLLQKS